MQRNPPGTSATGPLVGPTEGVTKEVKLWPHTAVKRSAKILFIVPTIVPTAHSQHSEK